MSPEPTNSSRETGSDDRGSDTARERIRFWLCECGLATESANAIHHHTQEHGHFAEKIDTSEGEVIAFIAGGLEHKKYSDSIPDTAQVKRRKKKNEPLFEDPSV